MSYNYPQPTSPQTVSGYTSFRPQTPQYVPTSWGAVPQVRPVSSIEEVKAYPIDFDGSVFYFPDIANKRIYTKQINADGSATLNVYEQKELPIGNMSNNNYITREEFEAVIEQLRASVIVPPQQQAQAPVKKEEYMQF